ncbi:Target of EGR1, member 1 (Nuclear) [Lobosporangium transversale]|uniref:Ribonuclease CAF1 n=1 Tax=Lobosporangium transversale TaxID=64571 RepID=A0A1Y2G9G6_9FUNG|nr:ribonuclease CAF1 [Lobosporangium transversale]KAF9914246.1 Target of EGR1, member 1 (Nuclear) [Lobosporangium transversale]ORZ04809.1 ribonuclease CAF1 [Lobosporangium transversale]|eukprot:XP_021876746.1 ribonuclease CAF1 [Lobosporangium transversale]
MPVTPLPLPTYNQVTKHNLAHLQPMIVLLLKQATFIALDAEFTGLGPKAANTRAKDIQERYQHLCALAKSHALVAVGLSIFVQAKATQPSTTEGTVEIATDAGIGSPDLECRYHVHNFNFSMLSESDYAVSPKSMLFLAESGLDLNQWIIEGIPYTGGNRLTNDGGRGNPNGIMRSIFKRIMNQRVPVVVHNGFLDLIFLYQSFYAELPPKMSTFVADLSDMFPGGLFDTKYISDYITRERASFLAFLFRKYERDNNRAREARGSSAERVYSSFDVQPRLFLLPVKVISPKTEHDSSQVGYCEDYAMHGVCKKNMRCGKSHDLDMILDAEEERSTPKRRKIQTEGSNNSGTNQETVENEVSDVSLTTSPKTAEASVIGATEAVSSTAEVEPTATTSTVSTVSSSSTRIPDNMVQPSENFHSAYFDAFMTGTVFSHQLNQHSRDEIVSKAMNRIYLIGKNIPLRVEKSAFAKYSPEHERQRLL